MRKIYLILILLLLLLLSSCKNKEDYFTDIQLDSFGLSSLDKLTGEDMNLESTSTKLGKLTFTCTKEAFLDNARKIY